MRGSLSAELLKLRKRPATWLIGAVFVTLGLVFAYLLPYLSYRGSGAQQGPGGGLGDELLLSALPSSLVPSTLSGWPLFGGALALVLGALVTGSEYGWGTLKTILTQRPGRLAVLGAKVTATAMVTAIMVLVSMAADAGASWAIATTEDRAVDWPPLLELAQGLAVGWLIVTMWCVAGMFLGTVLRGTAVSVGIGLVWALVLEQLVRGFASTLDAVDALQRWLPGTNAGALVAALGARTQQQGGGTPGVTDVVGGTHATLVVAGYLIALVAASAVVLRRRDVT
jgi:ABC-type transport system involved in multi-copper enzyme maturation permease subunit